MALPAEEIRAMKPEDRRKALAEHRGELMHERGQAAMGGAVKNPGRIGDLRTTIARILTVEREEAAAAAKAKPRPAPKPKAKPAAGGASASKAAAKPAKPAKAAKGGAR